MKKKNLEKLVVLQAGLARVPGASFLSDCSKLPTKCLLFFSLCLRLVSSLCACGFERERGQTALS